MCVCPPAAISDSVQQGALILLTPVVMAVSGWRLIGGKRQMLQLLIVLWCAAAGKGPGPARPSRRERSSLLILVHSSSPRSFLLLVIF